MCVCVCVCTADTSSGLSQYVAHNYAGLYRKGAPSPLRSVLALPRVFSLTCKADIDHPMCDNNEMSALHFMCFSPILGTILLSLFLITSTSDQLPTVMPMCTFCTQCTISYCNYCVYLIARYIKFPVTFIRWCEVHCIHLQGDRRR